MPEHFTPPINTGANPGADERKLLDQLIDLQREGEESKRRWFGINDAKDDLKLYRGESKPVNRNPFFAANFIQAFIDRMVAQLTDNRPILRVEHRKVGFKNMAKVLEKVMHSVWQESDLQPYVGLQINVPLRIKRRRAAVEEAHARLERAVSERDSVEDEVRFAVETGVDRLEEARHVLRLYENQLLPPARDQVEAARAGFETGRNSFLALIEAERNLRTVRLGREEALANVSRRHAELQGALGEMPGPR